jgi:hypothetical protein
MEQHYFLKHVLLAAGLLTATAAQAQLAPDSVGRPPKTLFKAGLRLTHFRYAHDSKSWQFLLPLSLGAEYRVAPRLSFYTQLETDLSASSGSGRRRATQTNVVSAASAALGARYYYGHAQRGVPAFGRYLALEGSAEWEQVTAASWGTAAGRRRTTPTVLTPGVYALWGVQHRLRGHTWYDLSAGAGLLAPAYYNVERPVGISHWNVGGQATIRLFFGL